MNTAARTRTVALPSPTGAYRDRFAGGASTGTGPGTARDLLMVWIDRERQGAMTALEARDLAAALLAAADAVDADNGILHAGAARDELLAWVATFPDDALAEARSERLRIGDVVDSLDGLFGPDAVNHGTVTGIDADRVSVTADWLPEPVDYDRATAGRLLYLAEARTP